ncbi:MAG: LuxR C-terminal-related transcriptional regulator [Lawsonibacter sp.]|nr:LuxR C-terminal-related transcriptional regulator [Lawsonibacter sp.]
MARIRDGYFNASKQALTERETEIARLAAEGCSNKEIGERLYISETRSKSI